MSTTRHTPTQNDTGFQLKGGLYPLTSILLGSTEPNLLAEFIDSKIKQAPKFFQNSPVVIDLHRVAESLSSLNLQMLKSILTERHLIPVGVRGGNPEQQAAAVSLGLAVLPENSKEGSIEKSSAMHEVTETHFPAQNIQAPSTLNKVTTTKVITEPVRSGQQFYARGGDLIVLSSVSHGAELLADGHIHIYGPLRGRALAGVTGDTSAHIFCQSLEAELISIAGQYKISEDIEQSFWRLAVDISFHEGRLHIQPL